MHRFATALEKGQHKVQIGDGSNLVDWAYVGNVADAHILAADRLPSSPDTAATNHIAGQAFFFHQRHTNSWMGFFADGLA